MNNVENASYCTSQYQNESLYRTVFYKDKCKKIIISPDFEPGTFCVLDKCDNHYTTKTQTERKTFSD